MGIYYIIIHTFLFFFKIIETKEFFREIQKERKRDGEKEKEK